MWFQAADKRGHYCASLGPKDRDTPFSPGSESQSSTSLCVVRGLNRVAPWFT